MKTPPLIINETPQHRANSKKAMAKRAKAIREENRKISRSTKQGWGWNHNYQSATKHKIDRERKARKSRKDICDSCGQHKSMERRNQCKFCYNEAHQSGLQGYGKRPKKILDPHSGGTILLMGEKAQCPFPGCQWIDERRKLRVHLKDSHPNL